MRLHFGVVTIFCALAAQGCASLGIMTERPGIDLVRPGRAILRNDDVVISALDGSWELRSGGEFQPEVHSGLDLPGTSEQDALLSHYRQLLESPFEAVYRVQIDKANETFWGVLIFLAVPETAVEIAHRRWLLEIDSRFFGLARDGNVTAVWGTYDHQEYVNVGSDLLPEWELRPASNGIHWVLWLSDLPLWQEGF